MDKFKQYKSFIDIDYYVYFTKAYFAFNAYLKNKYPTDKDRDRINKIKDETSIKQKFKELLFADISFIKELNILKIELANTNLKTKDNQYISFSKVKVYNHKQRILFNKKYNRVEYNIRAVSKEQFYCKVKETDLGSFKYEELNTKLANASLTDSQKAKIKDVIDSFVSSYIQDLTKDLKQLEKIRELDIDEQKKITENLYRGFIEILYSLRNACFIVK